MVEVTTEDAGRYLNVYVDGEMATSTDLKTGEIAVYDPPGSEEPAYVAREQA